MCKKQETAVNRSKGYVNLLIATFPDLVVERGFINNKSILELLDENEIESDELSGWLKDINDEYGISIS